MKRRQGETDQNKARIYSAAQIELTPAGQRETCQPSCSSHGKSSLNTQIKKKIGTPLFSENTKLACLSISNFDPHARNEWLFFYINIRYVTGRGNIKIVCIFPFSIFTHTHKHTRASRQQLYLVSPEVKQPGLRGHNGPFRFLFYGIVPLSKWKARSGPVMDRFKKPEPITSDHSTAQVNNQRGGKTRKKENPHGTNPLDHWQLAAGTVPKYHHLLMSTHPRCRKILRASFTQNDRLYLAKQACKQ